MFQFFRECKEELNKVIWPNREEVVNSTWIVMVAVMVISIFLFLSDYTFESIFDAIISLGTVGNVKP